MNKHRNTEPAITNFTLAELIDMAGDDRKGLMAECIAANSETQMQSFRNPIRIDAFIIGIGTEGETSVSFNLREFDLKKDSMFIFGPQSILQMHSNENFKAQVLVISTDLMRRINIDTKHIIPLLLQFGNHPCIELSPEESRQIRNFISLVESETQGPETDFAREIICELIAASIYKICDILCHYLAEHPEIENSIHSRAEEYFKQFAALLSEHFRTERSVKFYATKLCITPKYLTTLIKRISGKSVSEWIDNYVTIEAKTLLKYSNMSVQEIAYHLNFPNQSFFGSYFKRNTGISPSQYKAEQ